MKHTLQIVTLFMIVGYINSQTIQVFQSARDTGDRLTQKPSIQFNAFQSPNAVSVTVNRAQHRQEVLGFGGALTDAAAVTFSQINAGLQNQFVEAYFGKTGIGYSVCRTNINSCDFSPQSYSFDDNRNDYDLTNFNVSHNEKIMFPFLKKVLSGSVQPVKLFGSPWSPPAWMKSNGQMTGSNQPGLIQDPKIFTSWALYLSKVVTAYHNEGIDFWGLTIQNEPEFAAPWEACCYNPAQQRDFLKNYLGPQLRKDHPNLKIMVFDHNKDHVADWVRTIFTDASASNFADGTAFHWYSGPQFENLAQAHSIAPSKFLLATEACNCPPSIGNWGYGENYGYDIIGDLNNWAVGWTDWNILLNLQGGPNHLNNFCGAPVHADTGAQKLLFESPYYYMGQISKYITPGSIILNTGVSDGSLSAVSALTKDGKTVVVVLNRGNNAITYTLQDGSKSASVTSPAHSIHTLIYTL